MTIGKHPRRLSSRDLARGLLVLALSLASQVTALGTSWGDTPAAAPAPTTSAAGGAGAVPLTVIDAAPTCARCEPASTELELLFSVPVDATDLSNAIVAEPYVTLIPDSPGVRRRVRLRGVFAPQTHYTVTLDAGFCAPTRECLAEPSRFTFRTGGGYPVVRMPTRETVLPPTGRIPMRLVNVERAEVRLIEVAAHEIAPAMAIVGYHDANTDPFAKLPDAMKARARRVEIDVDGLPEDGAFELDPFAGGAGKVVLVLLSAKGAGTRVGLYQRGTLGALVKLGADGGLVWVTDTSTGRPVAGATVSVLGGARPRHGGTTGADGLVRLPSRERLRSPGDAGPIIAVVQAQGQTVFTAADFTDGVEPWAFDLPYYYYSGQEALRGVVATERGIYRPGEPVHVLAVLRQRRADGRLVAPTGAVDVTVRDPDGMELAHRTAPLTAFGTARLEVTLPRVCPLGGYTLELSKDGVSFYHSFEVGEYRPASFEVILPSASEADLVEDTVVIPVEARYLYGAPVAGGRVAWTVSWRHRHLDFPGFEGFGFAGAQEHYYSHPQLLTEGTATLDAHGRALVRLPRAALPGDGEDAQSIDLVIEATVTDAADDTTTARTVQRLDRTDVFVGVASERWVVAPREGWDVRVVALDRRGRPRAGQALQIELERGWYDSVAEQGPHGVRYRTSREQAVVARREVIAGPGPVAVHFDLPGGGDYEVRVRAAGTSAVTATRVWAWGDGGAGAAENDPRVELRLDRDGYAPGDTARLHAAVPYPRATGLLTVERNGILSARVVELGGNDAPLEVPVLDQYLPNVFVGLSVVPRDAKGASPASGFPFRAGYAELRVSPESRRLEVEVDPVSTELVPGESARVKVRVRDHAGQPVRAEVTLWAADEGVLMLTGYRTPDPFAPVYARHELDVSTATNLLRWTQYDAELWAEGGGDGGGEGTALRSRFLSTAFFSRGVVTDARGEATVAFALPDNVTRWRVMAVAADAGERFGRGESSVTASKALQVTPALPRFATEGDIFDAGFLVHNHTGSAAKVTVRLTAQGARILGAPAQELSLADGASQPVRFPLAVGAPGELALRAEVAGSGRQDALVVALPVHDAARVERRVLSQGALAGELLTELAVPDFARAGSAAVEIVTSPSLLASLAPGIESLLEYPYGCAEQKTSRLIPMVVLGDLIAQLGIRGFDPRKHRARLEDTLAELEQHQSDNGGFGLWVGSEPDPFITAYVLFGWLVAKDHGFPVSAPRLARGVHYLADAVGSGEPISGYFSLRADPFAGYVLARAGADDRGLLERLASKPAELTRADEALVAAGLAYRARAGEAVTGLPAVLSDLQAARQGAAERATIPERSAGGSLGQGSDLQATALAAHALVIAGRVADAEALVRGVLDGRLADGTWGCTYDNLLAVLAVGDVVAAAPPARGRGEVVIAIDGTERGRVKAASASSVGRLVLGADVLPAPGSSATLRITAPAGARFEHLVSMRYLPVAGSQGPRSRGYGIERAVFDAVSGEPVKNPTVGQLLRVRLTVEAPGDRRQVALTDRLPAGFEAVNARLATEQKRVGAAESWQWSSSEVRDERVSFFANHLDRGTTTAEYLARVSRSGEFVWPAATVESMYRPGEDARTGLDQVTVGR